MFWCVLRVEQVDPKAGDNRNLEINIYSEQDLEMQAKWNSWSNKHWTEQQVLNTNWTNEETGV